MIKRFYRKLDYDLYNVFNEFCINKVSNSVFNVLRHTIIIDLDLSLLSNMGSEIDKENE